jgi:protein-disulfide isomerase
MYRTFVAAVALLGLVSAPALAATSAPAPKETKAVTQTISTKTETAKTATAKQIASTPASKTQPAKVTVAKHATAKTISAKVPGKKMRHVKRTASHVVRHKATAKTPATKPAG